MAAVDFDGYDLDPAIYDEMFLLRVYHAFEAYNRRYSVEVRPDQVLDLLVTDPMLPSSLCRSLDMAAELASIGSGPDVRSSDAARRLAGRMSTTIGRTGRTVTISCGRSASPAGNCTIS